MNRHAKLSEVKDGYYVVVKKTFTTPSKYDAIAIAKDQGIPEKDIHIKEASNNGDK